METSQGIHSQARSNGSFFTRLFYQISLHWLAAFGVVLGLYVGLPFLAPVFMHIGWSSAGQVIYAIYSTQCHQLPERSFFLFGPQAMYPLSKIQSVFQQTFDPLVLRRFVGNPDMGWKVAWSDRMVSMYTSVLVFGLFWGALRRRIKPLPWWGFFLFLLPMALDGSTHFISDLAGIAHGFRDSNAWLAALTHNALPAGFYAGDALGSFNSWMRLLTGGLFGMGVVWFGFPYLDESFAELTRYLKTRLNPGLTDADRR
ncbi:MAG TPA: DUF2085 domain-containing protein [Anaerolineales bacterium]